MEATVEHPFFVIGQGWSAYNPERTRNFYGLVCHRLQVGDVCISLTHRDIAGTSASSSTLPTTTTTTTARSSEAKETREQSVGHSPPLAPAGSVKAETSGSLSSPDAAVAEDAVKTKRSSRTRTPTPLALSSADRKRSCSPPLDTTDDAKHPRRVRSAS